MENVTIGKIRLGNKRKDSDHKPEIDEVVIDIGRPNLLGNPYRVDQKTCRATALLAFSIGLDLEMKRREGERYDEICRIAEMLLEGKDVILMCWCVPLQCHGEAVIKWVERLISEKRK